MDLCSERSHEARCGTYHWVKSESNKPWTWEQCEFQIEGLGMFSPPVLIEIHDEMVKDHPKKEDGPLCLPDVCLSFHHFTSSLQVWLSFLCCETFFRHRTSQAWLINHLWGGNEDSGRHAMSLWTPGEWELALQDSSHLLTTLVWPITFIFSPNETELRKPLNCFYKQPAMAYCLLSMAWSGLVGAACVNKNSRVFHGWGSEANV